MSVRHTLAAALAAAVLLAGCKDEKPTQVIGLPVSVVPGNGSTIIGTVVSASTTPFAAFSRSPSRSASLASARAPKRRFSPDRIIVGFKNDALGVAAGTSNAYRSMTVARQTASRIRESVASLSQRNPISQAEVSPALVAARVKVEDTTRIDAVMAALRNEPDVAWVERDEVISIRDGAPGPMAASTPPRVVGPVAMASPSVVGKFPSDPSFYQQYWPANMVDLPRAWSITTGSPSVIVASVDMGIRFDHPEIAANLTNDGYDFVSNVGFGTTETFCDGGTFTTIDGDGDGPDPDPTDPDDIVFNGVCWEHSTLGDHGLWTAGIIGAVGNDGVGMAGVNWNVKIRPIRVLGITGDGTNFDIAQGVLYAAGLPAVGANGAPVQAPSRAQIINVSLGGGSPSATLLNAVNAAYAAGSLIVASAGNAGGDFPTYPAAFPNVMAVAAVGMDGLLATYSNAGTYLSVAAPGGDFRLYQNDNGRGGGGILGPGWDFATNKPTYLFGFGTSASAPYVSAIAALLLAQTPTLTPTQLRSRIEQFATRPAGATRGDLYGWGIVNAYNSLTQQTGPTRSTIVRLVNAPTGTVFKTTTVNSTGAFAFTQVPGGTYYVQAGDDESGDGVIGVPGRRFAWAGGFGAPTALTVNANSQAVGILLGLPSEVEPNDDVAHANMLSVGSYVVGNITTPDTKDVYSVYIPTAGAYTFETSGLVGSCGLGLELDTFISVSSQANASIGTNDNFTSSTGRYCSRLQPTLTPGLYYVTVTGTGANGLASRGRYRLEIRSGT